MMPERWKVYKERESDYWEGLWIVRPPGATFERSYAFTTHRAALQFAVEKEHWISLPTGTTYP
jgi:hypothetical protein